MSSIEEDAIRGKGERDGFVTEEYARYIFGFKYHDVMNHLVKIGIFKEEDKKRKVWELNKIGKYKIAICKLCNKPIDGTQAYELLNNGLTYHKSCTEKFLL